MLLKWVYDQSFVFFFLQIYKWKKCQFILQGTALFKLFPIKIFPLIFFCRNTALSVSYIENFSIQEFCHDKIIIHGNWTAYYNVNRANFCLSLTRLSSNVHGFFSFFLDRRYSHCVPFINFLCNIRSRISSCKTPNSNIVNF